MWQDAGVHVATSLPVNESKFGNQSLFILLCFGEVFYFFQVSTTTAWFCTLPISMLLSCGTHPLWDQWSGAKASCLSAVSIHSQAVELPLLARSGPSPGSSALISPYCIHWIISYWIHPYQTVRHSDHSRNWAAWCSNTSLSFSRALHARQDTSVWTSSNHSGYYNTPVTSIGHPDTNFTPSLQMLFLSSHPQHASVTWAVVIKTNPTCGPAVSCPWSAPIVSSLQTSLLSPLLP